MARKLKKESPGEAILKGEGMKKKSKLPVSRHLLSDMVIIIGWNYEREML